MHLSKWFLLDKCRCFAFAYYYFSFHCLNVVFFLLLSNAINLVTFESCFVKSFSFQCNASKQKWERTPQSVAIDCLNSTSFQCEFFFLFSLFSSSFSFRRIFIYILLQNILLLLSLSWNVDVCCFDSIFILLYIKINTHTHTHHVYKFVRYTFGSICVWNELRERLTGKFRSICMHYHTEAFMMDGSRTS